MATKIHSKVDYNFNEVISMRLEQANNSNQSYANGTPTGRLVYRPDLQRAVLVTASNNNNYGNQLAYLSDITSGGGSTPIPANTYFVSSNFSNSNNYYSTLQGAYNVAPSGSTIIVYAGSYAFPPSISKNISIFAIGAVTFTTNTNINCSNSTIEIIGNIRLEFGVEDNTDGNDYQMSFSGCNVKIDVNWITAKKILFAQGNDTLNANVIYSHLEYQQGGYNEWHILKVNRFGNGATSGYSANIANPELRVTNGSLNTHGRFDILSFKGNYIIGNNATDCVLNGAIEIVSSVIYANSSLQASWTLSSLGLTEDRIIEILPFHIRTTAGSSKLFGVMSGGYGLRGYTQGGSILVHAISGVSIPSTNETIQLGAILRLK